MQRLAAQDQPIWFETLADYQQVLVKTAWELLAREQTASQPAADCGFIVFPMAKAYEGFLKSYLYNLSLITQSVFQSRRFRIGRALNPDVRPEHRNGEWLYDDVVRECGRETARQLWDTWLICRNQVFHYFPDKAHPLSLDQAEQLLGRLEKAMTAATACQRYNHPNK